MSEPPPLAYEVRPAIPPARPIRLVAVPAFCLAAAWLVGASTNAINGLISRTYFDVILGNLYDVRPTAAVIVAQGLAESTAFGILLAIGVTITYVASTRCRLPVRHVAIALAKGTIVCLLCWTIGGAIGAVWAGMSPSTFRQFFILVAWAESDRVRWGFVGGSISGAYVGALLALLVSSIVIHLRWQKIVRSAADAL